MIPDEPAMLLSFVNMKLRDGYPTFSALCEDLELSAEEITEKLQSAGYRYDAQTNRFI